MICLDLRGAVDTRPGREAFAVADALGAAGYPVGVATQGGLAPTRYLARAPVLARPPAGQRTTTWPLPAGASHPPFPVSELAYWKGEPKPEHAVAFASREGWLTLQNCRHLPAAFLGVDAEHEVSALEQLRRAAIAVFSVQSPQCLVTPAEAMAAGCVVLAADDWPLPGGARAGEHAWVVPEPEIPAALGRLLEDAQRGTRRALRDAGFALAARWRPALLAERWRECLCPVR